MMAVLMFGSRQVASAQSQEVQQLVLNVEKLSQLKNILSDMKRGYEVVSKGYTAVKDIAKGNFSLHQVFLDGLWLVSPEVRKYYKIAHIISYQQDLVSEYKAAYKRFSSGGNFSATELDYVSKVYGRLLETSLDNLDRLAMVITANKMRMGDGERLIAIDQIFGEVEDKLIFLRSFNRKTSLLNLQRQQEKSEIKGLGGYFKREGL
ncbi:TerB family tellurite resistance protein [Pedobacter sp. GSP4]|uniref:TerB family tellurite resistance protein n=1 Tax=Pedobacter sp. GSP4 TaxID=3453716 RepID=UPI003EEA192A